MGSELMYATMSRYRYCASVVPSTRNANANTPRIRSAFRNGTIRFRRSIRRRFYVLSSHAVPLTFVAGSAHDVLGPDLARAVEALLRQRFAIKDGQGDEPYRSDEVDVRGWVALQQRIPHIAGIDAYQAVFIDAPLKGIEEIALPNVADPFHVASLPSLVDALQKFAAGSKLPTDD